MIVNVGDFKDRIRDECRESPLAPKFPELSRGTDIVIPSLDWFKRTWFPFWCDLRESRRLRQRCNLVAGVAAAEANWCAWLQSIKTGSDYTAPVFEARIDIYQPPLLGIYGGKHSNCLIAFTEDRKTYQLALWEPQSPETAPFRYALLKDALTRCFVYDVLL
jgi:hypothetical protein